MTNFTFSFNGKNLDELIKNYETVNIYGRSLLAEELETVKVLGRDGEVVLNSQYPSRKIMVEFLIRGLSNRDKLEKLRQLSNYLYSKTDVEIVFGDFPDVYWFGRVSSFQEPPGDYFQGIGTITILCSDPHPYSGNKESTGFIAANSIFPVKIERITATIKDAISKLIIKNEKNGQRIILDDDFRAGQVIEITKDRITKNGQNILMKLDYIDSEFQNFKCFGGDGISATGAGLKVRYRERLA